MTPQVARATRAWVLHPDISSDRARKSPESALAEALALARALPWITVVGHEVVRLARPTPGYLLGRGKRAELGDRLKQNDIDLVLVDGALSPVQQRNLEKSWGVKLLDRTGLILEIFADRAQTREGVLQVELAALTYQRTRLVRAWTHLERQRGGLGFVGGPGETQIEADRRAIDTAITRIRRQLGKVRRTRALHRAARARHPYPVVALVGYTNAGKSTLFNRLTGARVEVRDQLFATLDPTMRELRLPSGQSVILSDTVGFISDLPTQLVAAFRATLEEVLGADLIVHVRDISHPDTAHQAADVTAILAGLGVAPDAALIEVWNKIDNLDTKARAALATQAARSGRCHLVSALTGAGIDGLCAALGEALSEQRFESRLELDYAQGQQRAWLFEQGVVEHEARNDTGYQLRVSWTARQKSRFQNLK
ncbi:MAG: GTPase HflX [Paracoccaceae bacterium]